MIFKILFYGFLIYLLYRIVFHFVIPIYRTTKQVKEGFRRMQENMQQQADPYASRNERVYQQTQKQHGPTQPDKQGDYIDFEEVKD